MSENKIIISYKDKEINATIVELCETYSAITPKAIEYIAPIYYPIAYIELSMKEKTFEDFEPIQLAVLKLIILGFTECSVIANLLGLNSIYIEQIKKLLYGYQFIDDNSNITSLGRESVAAEKKIQLMDSRQVFQLDTINSRLIKLSDSIPDKSLKRKEQLSIKKAILNHPNYVDSDTIVNSLRDDEFRNIMSQRTGVLNTNVVKISDIECIDVVYAESYLVKVKNLTGAVIFAKRNNLVSKKYSDKYKYVPFFVLDESDAKKLKLKECAVANNPYQIALYDKISQLLKYSKSDSVKKVISEGIEKIILCYGLDAAKTIFDEDELVLRIVDKTAFSTFNFETVRNICQLGSDGVIICSNPNFAGNLIRITISSNEFAKTAKALCDIVNMQGESNNSFNIKLVLKKLKNFAHKNELEDENISEIIDAYYAALDTEDVDDDLEDFTDDEEVIVAMDANDEVDLNSDEDLIELFEED